MNLKDIAIPDIYKSSSDFRFFIDWFIDSLIKIQYDTEHLIDIYDPLRCPQNLLWMLGDTVGYEYDDRLPAAFNRLVLLYFMNMIRNRGSQEGVMLAAEINLSQFNIINQGANDSILENRLEDVSIPVNTVYVTPHTEDGYIDVVYFSTKLPVDACIEYVRPVGMYLFQHAGVRYDARTNIAVDARLIDKSAKSDIEVPTHIGHYTRSDYAALQKQMGYSDIDTANMNISNWLKNIDFPISNKFDETTGENILTYTTVPYYERFYNLFEVKKNTDYIFEFDFCCPSGFTWGGYHGVYEERLLIVPGNDTQLDHINTKNMAFTELEFDILAQTDSFTSEPSDKYTHYKLSFNSKDNNKIYIILDFSQVEDRTDTTYKIKNIKLYPKLARPEIIPDTGHIRNSVYYRNSRYEKTTDSSIDPGYRALYSLQLCNNDQIVESLLSPIFSIGFGPQQVSTTYPDNYLKNKDEPMYNLRYDRNLEESITDDVYTVDNDRTKDILNPRPAINPVMSQLGDNIDKS